MERLPARYRASVIRHPALAALLAALAIFVLATALQKGRELQAVAYLAAVVLSVLVIDSVLLWRPISEKPVPVRHPRIEFGIASFLFLVALGWLLNRFEGSYTIPSVILRLLAVGAVFNVLLALALLALRYGPGDLGIRFGGFAPVPPVILCFGVLAMTCAPAAITLKAAYLEAGSIWGLLLGIGAAALPEEFFRFVWQTRAAACFDNRAAGWLLASVLWAVLHLPIEYSQSHSLAETLTAAANIIPLGLVWGYLTMRTQSILPSVLLHGTNLWGLQNL